jgi:uncharacterized membrane protein
MNTYYQKISKIRGQFFLLPLVISIIFGTAGAVLSHWEEQNPSLSNWIPSVLFPSKSDPAVAQAILSTIASAVMTVVSLVISVLLLTLTLASMQFSPRIIINFIEDKRTQYTFGIFLGTFGYCLAAMGATRSLPQPFAPILTVTVAMLLAFVCIIFLLMFINHISLAISANHIIHQLARQTEKMIDEMMPAEKGQHTDKQKVPEETNTDKIPVVSTVSGYIRSINTRQLLRIAAYHQTNVEVIRRVGHFVPAGIPILILSGPGKIRKEKFSDFQAAFEFGPTRTLKQDVEFGILKIVDIALKAISPAVNDPSTAVNCIDQLSAVLIYFCSRNPTGKTHTNTDGKVVVTIPWLDFERLVDSAFEQIRMYAKTDVAVNLRLLRAFGDIAQIVADKPVRMTLAERGRKILASCEKNFEDDEIIEMKRRMIFLEKLSTNQ